MTATDVCIFYLSSFLVFAFRPCLGPLGEKKGENFTKRWEMKKNTFFLALSGSLRILQEEMIGVVLHTSLFYYLNILNIFFDGEKRYYK